METKKQTALNIIIENFNLLSDNDFKTWFLNSMDKLEAMEKEQIKNAWVNAWQESFIEPLDYQFYEPEAEQYYNETYGGEK